MAEAVAGRGAAPAGRHHAWLGLGANLGDPARQIVAAMTALDALPGSHLFARSGLYQSAAWGASAPQPDYLNAVAGIATTLAPADLLAATMAIERQHGRTRGGDRYAARPLDIDLLLYDDQRLASAALTLPHPHLHERAFVLLPLAEIAPDVVVPGRGTVAALLAQLPSAAVGAVRRLPEGPR